MIERWTVVSVWFAGSVFHPAVHTAYTESPRKRIETALISTTACPPEWLGVLVLDVVCGGILASFQN